MEISVKVLKPMEPVLYPEPFDNDEFVYQVKWDGVRILSYINKNGVVLINKRNHVRTTQYPELSVLTQLLKGHDAILDGEIVVLKNGKPSFPSVMRRDLSINQSMIAYLQKLLPIDYMIFDILHFDGKNLIKQPLYYRQQLLTSVFNQAERFHLVDNFPRGKSLFQAVKDQDLEGIVAKKLSSHYIPGKHHKEWMKIKYRRQQNCAVGGYTLRGNIINSLLLGMYQENQLIYIGKAGTGLKAADWLELTIKLSGMRIDSSPFVNFPVRTNGRNYFVNPQLAVNIEFAEWTEEMQLRSPVIKGVVSSKPENCVIE